MSGATLHRWDDLPTESPMSQLARQRVIGEKVMVSRITLHRGCQVPMHSHANEQMSCVLTGRLKFSVGEDARTVIVGPGEVLLLPAHVPHAAEALEETVVLDIFSPPSQTTGIDVPST
jgi:quercetin dioxygenase-like cupin family protein